MILPVWGVWAASGDDEKGGRSGKMASASPMPDPRATAAAAADAAARTARAARHAAASEAMCRYRPTGDPAAFHEVYRNTAADVHGFLCRRVDRLPAEDILQQTYLHVHVARASFRPGADVYRWIRAIARNLVIDYVRRGGRELPFQLDEDGSVVEPPCPAGGADELMMGRQLEARLQAAHISLPENQRAAFELIRFEGMSYEEAAETMGKTVAAVTSLLHRAMEAMHRARAGQEEAD